MPQRRYVTQAEFARLFGVKEPSITEAIQRGRIKRRRRDGHWVIDLQTEAAKFAATSHTLTRPVPSPAALAGALSAVPNSDGESALNAVVHSRERREKFKALREEMDYEKEMGRLIPMSAVEERWGKIAVTVRKSILALPDRLAPLMAAEDDARECWKMLDQECRAMLEDLATDLKQGGGGGSDEGR